MSGADWVERLGGLESEALGEGLELRHARSRSERRRGLAGLQTLAPHVGLRIHRCRAVHTVGMRFALDLVWLDADGRVVRVDVAVAPRRHRVCLAARSVVEVAAGHADRFASRLAPRGGCG